MNMRKLHTLFLIFVAVFPAYAWAADAEPIGRLFSTPAQRAALDRLREKGAQGSPTDEQPLVTVTPLPEPASAPRQITLDGFVRRSSGKTTTWINRTAQNEEEASQGVRVQQQRSRPPVVSIMLPSGDHVGLKVGQSFDAASGKVSEVYETAPAEPVTPVN